ncbi:hypothetical protein PsyrCH409_18565 [Pseudomonas viridiflava]|nr:hypothetical protein PsyrCH409_18565 [Pseudomonas viridiflava]
MRDIHFFDDGFNGVQGRHTLMSKRSMQSVEHESCQAVEDGQLTEIKGVLSGCGVLDGRGLSGMPNLTAMGVRKTEWAGAEGK